MKNIRLILTVCVLAMVLLFADLAWADTAPEETAYTVDFYYGEAEYHLPGGGSMLLSRLLDALQIVPEATVETATFSDASLLSAVPDGTDWRLTSLAPFESQERLMVALANGRELMIRVEDASQVDGGTLGIGSGGNCYWWLDTDGVLRIRPNSTGGWNASTQSGGTATIGKHNGNNYTNALSWPWDKYRSQIKKVIFQGDKVNVAPDISLASMFEDCVNLTSVDVSSLNTENATSFKQMFKGCTRLKEADLGGFKSNNKIAEMQSMFSGCSSLESVTLNNPYFVSRMSTDANGDGFVEDGGLLMQNMFKDCTNLKTVDMSNITVYGRDDRQQFNGLFKGLKSLETVKLNNIKTPNVKNYDEMFMNCPKLTNVEMKSTEEGSNSIGQDAVSMQNMFKDSFKDPQTEGDEKATLDVSGFGTLNNIVNMDGFVKGCTNLQTLILDNLDNSRIGPTNDRHSISEAGSGTTGAREFGRELGIETCTNLKTLSAQNSKVWMVNNNRGLPGSEYYQAANESDLYYFTKKKMKLTPDGEGKDSVDIETKRDYIDIITNRRFAPGYVPEVEIENGLILDKGKYPDKDTNKNVNFDLNTNVNTYVNTNDAGFLAPGVYTIQGEDWAEPEVKNIPGTFYRILFIGSTDYSLNASTEWDERLVVSRDDDDITTINTRNVSEINDWRTSGSYTIDNCGIEFKYIGAALDINGVRHDVIITIDSITFKDLNLIPTENTVRGEHDGNNYVSGKNYYRTVLKATKEDGLTFQNYVMKKENGNNVRCLSGGSGTDISFSIKIDGAEDGSTFLFYADDLDVAAAQEWEYPNDNDPCYDKLPLEKVTYGINGESFILGEGNDFGSITFAEHTGLRTVDRGNKGVQVISTGSDPSTPWSEFYVKADARGSQYTWVSGIACDSYALQNVNSDTTLKVDIPVTIGKIFENGDLTQKHFNFILEGESTDPNAIYAPIIPANGKQATTNDNGVADFGLFSYTVPLLTTDSGTTGTLKTGKYSFKYTVKEVPDDPADPGIAYDNGTHTLKIVLDTEALKDDEGIISADALKKGPKVEVYWDDELNHVVDTRANKIEKLSDSLTITNKIITTSVIVKKEWNDNDNQDGKRPDSIMLYLNANGKPVDGAEYELTAQDNWTYTFTDLPAYKNGQKITYTVTENIQELQKIGYEMEATQGEGSNEVVLTNKYDPEHTSVAVIKVWDDGENQDGLRPDSVVVQLLADGEVVQEETLTAERGWGANFGNLPKYKDGKEITYTVREKDALDGYTVSEPVYEKGTWRITNTQTTEITVSKIWDDKDNQDGLRPDSVVVQLLADGEVVQEETLTAERGWGANFGNLPKYKDGKEITYTVREKDALDGYTVSEPVYEKGTWRITNTQIQDITVTKVWKDDNAPEGLRPHAIKVTLLADGEECEVQEIEPDADGNWTHTFKDMPKYKGGKEITYTVKEHEHDNSEKYTSTVTGDVKQGFTITNTYITKPEPQPPTPYYPDEPGGFTNCITFTKEWRGDVGDHIDYTMYYPDGTIRVNRLPLKYKKSETEWVYEGYVSSAGECYIIEDAQPGYKVRYENVAPYENVTDRCYNGGRIINYKVPKTGDTANLALWIGLAVLGLGGLSAAMFLRKRRGMQR